jgi:glycosyltransferase involved in cell wall biosynthesis
MSRPLVSFVTPTLDRPTLGRTQESIVDQTDDSWEAIFVYDPRRTPAWLIQPQKWGRFLLVPGCDTSAGLLRNEGIARARGEWVAFVDDDDVLHEFYVAHLRQHVYSHRGVDVVVFRMQHPNYGILPDPANPQIAHGRVGISYAVRRDALPLDPFIREDLSRPGPGNEDIDLLLRLRGAGHRFFISPHVDYLVRPGSQGGVRELIR